MSKQEFIKRCMVFTSALFFSALGVSLITSSYLGTSPISSLPFVMSQNTPWSMGSYIFILNLVLIVLQLLVMGKNEIRAHWLHLTMQVPISIIFGLFVDMCMFLLQNYYPTHLFMKLTSLMLGCTILAFGIALEVVANITMVSGEYTVLVISKRFDNAFGNIKICFDLCLIVMAICASLTMSGTLQGIGLGTIIAAILTGPIVRLITPHLHLIGAWQHTDHPIKTGSAEHNGNETECY